MSNAPAPARNRCTAHSQHLWCPRAAHGRAVAASDAPHAGRPRALTAGCVSSQLSSLLLLTSLLLGGCNGDKTSPSEQSGNPPTIGSDDRTGDRNDGDSEDLTPAASPRSVTTHARFRERTDTFRESFAYRTGQEQGHFSILESLGGGVAVLDYDADGWPDLFYPGGGHFGDDDVILGYPGQLFRNVDGNRFEAVGVKARVDQHPYYSHGAAAADYDNDGFVDILVTGYGGLVLFHNQGDGTYLERASVAGLDDRSWSSSAAWSDLDSDGDPDLYVAHYVDWSFDNNPTCPAAPGSGPNGTTPDRDTCPPRSFSPLPDSVWENNGDGTFRNVSDRIQPKIAGKGLGVVIGDIDLDNDPDIYVTNDTTDNFLFRNDGDWKFEDIGIVSATALDDRAIATGSMGTDLGDFNLDGLPDICVANYEAENTIVYRNLGGSLFQDVSRTEGLASVQSLLVGWGTVFLDFDRDADEDILISNGHVIRFPINAPVRQRPVLFENTDHGRFRNIASGAGPYMASAHEGRGVAVGDLDRDGDVDAAVSHVNHPVTVLFNETQNDNHWLSIRLTGCVSNRDAIGALIEIRTEDPQAEDGERRQIRQIKAGTSYASTCDPLVFFGLGAAERVTELRIRWPSGAEQSVADVEADQELQFVEGRQSGIGQ